MRAVERECRRSNTGLSRKRGVPVGQVSNGGRAKVGSATLCLLGVIGAVASRVAVARAGEASSRPGSADPQAETAREIVHIVVGLGEEWQKSSPDACRTRELVNALAPMSERMPVRLRPMLRIYEARGLVLLGRSPAARSAVEHGLKGQTDAPDFLLLAARLGDPDEPESPEWHRDILDKLGAILPLSIFGRDRDSRRSDRMVEKVNPGPPHVPVSTDAEAFLEIGDIFARNARLREAVNSWLEGLYACQLLSEHKRAGAVWIKVAQAEDRLGRETLAVRAYLRAAHEDGAHTEVASAGVARVLSGEKTGKPEAQRRLDEATVSRLVGLYKRLNLHPLALSLIEKELASSPSKEALVRSVREEWDGIVGNLVATYKAGKNSYILGHRASDVADWSKIKVPRPSRCRARATRSGKKRGRRAKSAVEARRRRACPLRAVSVDEVAFARGKPVVQHGGGLPVVVSAIRRRPPCCWPEHHLRDRSNSWPRVNRSGERGGIEVRRGLRSFRHRPNATRTG